MLLETYMYSLGALLTLNYISKVFLIGELFLSETLELNSIRSLLDGNKRPYCTSKAWSLNTIELLYQDCDWPESYN